eukprot:TRINITY_DN15115_c0_g1_i1.p1 TRINITY_DN15115_c0_g1~~TRINITY_DN15115_c0_g1_i1.p1  ORF type:complete len:945 (+),score=88.03 TRINITY_DN15115_c0_g1_i1:473-3307(+)
MAPSFPLDLSKLPTSITHLTLTNQEDVSGDHGDDFAVLMSDGVWPASLLELNVGQSSITDINKALWVPPYVINAFALRTTQGGSGRTLQLCGMRTPTSTDAATGPLMTLYLPANGHFIHMDVAATDVAWLIPANQKMLGTIKNCAGAEKVSAMTCTTAMPYVRTRGDTSFPCPSTSNSDESTVRAILTQNIKPRLSISSNSLTLVTCTGFLPLFELSTPWLYDSPAISTYSLSNINAAKVHVITGASGVTLSVVDKLQLSIVSDPTGSTASPYSFMASPDLKKIAFYARASSTAYISISAPPLYLSAPIALSADTHLTLSTPNNFPIKFSIAPLASATVARLADVLEFNTPCGGGYSNWDSSTLNVMTPNLESEKLSIWGGGISSMWILGTSDDTIGICEYVSRRCKGNTCKSLPTIPPSRISVGKGILPLLDPGRGASSSSNTNSRPFEAQGGSGGINHIGSILNDADVPYTYPANQLHRSFLLHGNDGVSAWGFITSSTGQLNLSYIVTSDDPAAPPVLSYYLPQQSVGDISPLLEDLPEFQSPTSSSPYSNALLTFPSFPGTIFRSYPNGSVSAFNVTLDNQNGKYEAVRRNNTPSSPNAVLMMDVTSVTDGLKIRALDVMTNIAGEVVHAAVVDNGVYMNGVKIYSFDPLSCVPGPTTACNPTSIVFANMAGSAVFVVDGDTIKSIVAGVPSGIVTQVATGLLGSSAGSLKHAHIPPPGVGDGSHTIAYVYNTSTSALQFNVVRDPPTDEDWHTSTTYAVTIPFPAKYSSSASSAMFTNTHTVAFIPDPLQRFRVVFTASSNLNVPNVVSVLVAIGTVPTERDTVSSDAFEQELVCARSYGYSAASTISAISYSGILSTAAVGNLMMADLVDPLHISYRDGLNLWKNTLDASTGYELSLIHISEPTRLLSISYAVFCLKKKKKKHKQYSYYYRQLNNKQS